MVALYLDDNFADKRMARQLRTAGHLIYLPAEEVGTDASHDRNHLEKAVALGAVLAAKDIADFTDLHTPWLDAGRHHTGIIVCRELPLGRSTEYLGRAARLLTTETADNQLMILEMLRTEALGRGYVRSLSPRMS